jgi:hypothetical protein
MRTVAIALGGILALLGLVVVVIDRRGVSMGYHTYFMDFSDGARTTAWAFVLIGVAVVVCGLMLGRKGEPRT